jgi:hypothetical protein
MHDPGQQLADWRSRQGRQREHAGRLAQLRYVPSSESAARSLAENYVGLDLV